VSDRLLWAYGIVPAEAAPSVGATGVAGGAVEGLTQGALSVLVSVVPSEDFGAESLRANLNDLQWLERVAREHEAVLDELVAQTTVVPLRLCTIFADPDGARHMLEREREPLAEALARLEGRQEWGVKLLVDGERLAATAAPESDPARGEGGAAYLARRRNERQAREVARALAAQLVDEVDGALRAHAIDAVRLRPQNRELSGHTGEMLLNGAYLLDADQVGALRALADELQERYAEHGARIVVTGPWPPYNFAAGDPARQPA
jgi:Gas vesicle synthesis protein GvpL/GvpF